MKFTILHTADWHMDPKNRRFVEPAIEDLVRIARERKPDLAVHAGDLTVHRGATPDDIAWRVRRGCVQLSEAARHGLAVDRGNHDDEYAVGQHGTLTGVLAGAENPDEAITERIMIANTPRTIEYSHIDGASLAGRSPLIDLIMVPSPNQVWIRTLEQNQGGKVDDPAGLVEQIIQGMIAESRVKGHVPVVVYHGTLSGSKLGNEQQMTRGMDILLRRSAFRGAAAVLLGHVHRRQTLEFEEGLPKFCYPGAIAPLTWSEKLLEPVALLHTIDTETGAHEVEAIPLLVASQMIERTIEVDGLDADLPAAIQAELAGAPKDARVRVRARALGAVLADLTPARLEAMRQEHDLMALSVIEERTDDQKARFEIDKDLTMLQATECYLDIKAIEGEDAERVMAAARDIEGIVEDENIDACYELDLFRLEAGNWCQYPQLDIDLTKLAQLTAIDGPNHGGKSNAVRGIIFALYKRLLADMRLEKFVRKGQDKMWVQATFRSGPDIYRVRRDVKLASRGATCKTSLWRRDVGAVTSVDTALQGTLDAEAWVPIQAGTATETQKQIDALIGPYELFMAISYAGQNDVDRLLGLGDSETKDLLIRVLQRNFGGRQAIAKSIRSTVQQAADKARADIAALYGAVEKGERAEAGRPDALKAIKSASDSLADAPDPAADQQYIVDASQVYTAAQIARDASRLRQDTRTAAKLKVQGLERALATAGQEAQEIARIEGERQEAPDTTQAREAQRQAREKLDAIADQELQLGQASPLDRLLITQSEVEDAHRAGMAAIEADTRVSDLDAMVLQQGRDIGHQTSEITRLGDLLDGARRSAQLLKDVPCEGRDNWARVIEPEPGVYGLQMSVAGPTDMGGCQLLGDARAASVRIPVLQQNFDAAESALQHTTAAQDKTCLELGTERRRLGDEKTRLSRALQGACNDLDTERRRLDAARQDIRDAADAARSDHDQAVEIIQAAGQIREANARITERIAELRQAAGDQAAAAERLGEARAGFDRMPEVDLDAMDALVADAGIRFERAQVVARTNRSARDTWTRDLATAEAELKAIDLAIADAAADRETSAAASLVVTEQDTKARALDVYIEAMHRDGIPFLLIEQYAIPTLQERMNRYLAGTNMRIEISSERELTTGEARNTVNIQFRDRRGKHPLAMASGEQATSIGMSYNNGLADLHAAATGTKIWLSIQDEGFGTMKPEHLDVAKTTIRDIAAHRGRFIFISHVQGMSDCADSVLNVSVDGVDSRIEQIR